MKIGRRYFQRYLRLLSVYVVVALLGAKFLAIQGFLGFVFRVVMVLYCLLSFDGYVRYTFMGNIYHTSSRLKFSLADMPISRKLLKYQEKSCIIFPPHKSNWIIRTHRYSIFIGVLYLFVHLSVNLAKMQIPLRWMYGAIPVLNRFVWQQLEFAFFGVRLR